MKYTKLILDERMIVPEPKIRLEFFLHAIVTGETCELKPKTVDEEYLYAIATSDTSRMGEIYPRTLVEIYYDAILNNSVEDLPTPRTRWEEFLRSAVTKEPCELEPETSLEIYLSQISSNGGFDYIVSTSTNSTIISLPNSINGTIKSIEMDGNTLVNYCTNGSEELTLNNEINAQGTNVTLTDTVDDGKVDVVCEGNTLVNLVKDFVPATHTAKNYALHYNVANSVHTVVLDVVLEGNVFVGFFRDNAWVSTSMTLSTSGVYILKFTPTKEDALFRLNGGGKNVTVNKLLILEGDYTNKPIPSYFEGMKSAFELEDNKVEIVSDNSDNTLSNTHSIQLSEPLRGLPNGVCDKFVKQGGKWYVERNCGELKNISTILSTATGSKYGLPDDEILFLVSSDYFKNVATSNKLLFKGNTWASVTSSDQFYITSDNKLWLRLPAMSDSEAIEYLKDVIIVAELITPTYEEITDPQVITYLDATHISTNSTIPCNMKVTNSGYNAIIKPSTQYTVAFDTDKSGEVNIGLGGAKTSTTNNVATITTPSTLIDDSLRLYGKGIKASNVKLLEGDKTNYIPSYFEGMKSCFEDKEQDNGSYKVEVLSTNNGNVATISGYETYNDGYYYKNRADKINGYTVLSECAPNTTYTIRFTLKKYYVGTQYVRLYEIDNNGEILNEISLITGTFPGGEYETTITKTFTTTSKSKLILGINTGNALTFYLKDDVIISIGDKIIEKHKSNSIQLQLNEPLRAVGDVKDRFVLKDGKLMIERNCGSAVLDGKASEQWGLSGFTNDIIFSAYWNGSFVKTTNIMSDRFPLNPNIANNKNINEGIYYSSSSGSFRISILKTRLITQDIDGFKQWLQNNPTTVVYQLTEPTYEEVPTSQRLVCYENATLFIDTNIAPTHVEIEYPTEKQQLFRIK